jgi:hypothetical protein
LIDHYAGCPENAHLIRLRSLVSWDDVELNGIAFLQRLISFPLDRAVMDEDVGLTVVT